MVDQLRRTDDTPTATVDAYIARLHDLAMDCDERDRFYLFLADDELYTMEQALLESGEATDLLPALIDIYGQWRTEMGEEAWAALLEYDETLSDGSKNWLLGELDTLEGDEGGDGDAVGR